MATMSLSSAFFEMPSFADKLETYMTANDNPPFRIYSIVEMHVVTRV